MAATTRQSLITTTQRLVAQHGSHGTSFGDIVAASGAPRGSLYHHFPGGKEELVAAAAQSAADGAAAAMEAWRGESAAEVSTRFLDLWRQLLVRSDFAVGCAVVGVTVDADSPDLVTRGGEIFRGWTAMLADLLVAGGAAPARAQSLATLLVAGAEGAVVLARAQRDLTPFEAVAAELQAVVVSATDEPPQR